ncbi:rhodanese-like domain-containing protein [Shewanella sp. WXL01]|uniref:rhodanese-like domain-containing protein n=1 Tax=Shewanella sp. WXL01 TaxID=2709721 RepID=UPI001438351A|nr:rhodanese-like domain-containing protein [Shewanella sp. WXL01]
MMLFKQSLNTRMFATLACVLLIIWANLAQASEPSRELQAWDKIANGAMVIDVRTAEEFAAGHLDNAINIPFEFIVSRLAKLGVAKDTDIVLYCRSGRRSGIAHNELIKAGFTNSHNGGGYMPMLKVKANTLKQ